MFNIVYLNVNCSLEANTWEQTPSNSPHLDYMLLVPLRSSFPPSSLYFIGTAEEKGGADLLSSVKAIQPVQWSIIAKPTAPSMDIMIATTFQYKSVCCCFM